MLSTIRSKFRSMKTMRGWLLILALATVAGALVVLGKESARSALTSQCAPVSYPSDGTELIYDSSAHSVTIHRSLGGGRADQYLVSIDKDYPECSSQFNAFLAYLRDREAVSHAILCLQKRAYLDRTLDVPSQLANRLDYSPTTYATVQAAYQNECSSDVFKARHWGIDLSEAASRINRPQEPPNAPSSATPIGPLPPGP